MKARSILTLSFYVLWLAVYVRLLFMGDIYYYLNPVMKPFSWFLFLFFALLLAVSLNLFLQGMTLSLKKRYLVYLFPLLILLLMEPVTLGRNSLETRRLDLTLKRIDIEKNMERLETLRFGPREKGEGDYSIKEGEKIEHRLHDPKVYARYLKDIYDDYSFFMEETFSIRGFFHVDTQICRENQAMVARYVVSCCVADALVGGFVIEGEERPDFEPGDWIEVEGRLIRGQTLLTTFPVVRIHSIRPIKKLHPYVYPLY
jgi:uncharacterized repeat protein (TIGR03943 family)